MKTRTLVAAFSLVTVMPLVFSLVSCGTEIDKDGIFKDIEEEIELKDAVAKGNISDIVEYGGKLYAGGGKVYVKDNPEIPGGWRVFSDCPLSDGVVIRFDIDGSGTMRVQCAKNGNPNYFYVWTWLGWTTSIPHVFPSPTAAGGFSGQSVTCSYTRGGVTYYGTTSGAYLNSGGGWAKVPGSNVDAAIGSYYILDIYASPGGAIYVATIGTGTTNGTKRNGIWAYYGSTWNRE